MFSSKDLFFTPTSGAYTVSKSLRFRSGSTTYLNRTPTTPTSGTTWTWSGWIKRGALGSAYFGVFGAGSNGTTTYDALYYTTSTNTISFFIANGASLNLETTQVFRDPSAWYHLVAVYDSTQTTASDRAKLYINGVKVTAFSTATYPTQNTVSAGINANGIVNVIGASRTTAVVFPYDGYMAEVNFLDGYPTVGGTTYNATTWNSLNVATLFGAYDTNGIWQPAAYTGSYGNNGFYLKFTDVGATSGSNTGYGKDFAGTNYWTTNNFGTTSTATTYDSMLDSPTNAAGDIGNYCVLNPLDPTVLTLSSGNLDATYATNSDAYCTSTFRVSSGKWYWEYNITSVGGTYAIVGISSAAAASVALGSTASTYAYISSTGNKYNNGSATAYGNTYTSGAVVAVALDMDNGKLYFGLVSGGTITWQNTGDPVAGTNAAFTSLSGLFTPAINGRNSSNVSLNAGQRPFSASTLPSGFSALNSQNLTTPTITNGAQYMAAVTYTGSASTQNVTATSTNSGNNPNAVTFQPDLVWIKDRTNAQSHKLTDAVRGTTKAISTDSTAAEATDANGVTAFNNNGFSLGTGTRAYSDSNLDSYIAWQWKETSTAGFDIVSYAGDNTSNRNISHNLGVAPDFVWVKSLSTGSFYIWHRSLSGNTSFLKCNSTDGTNAQTTTNTPWGTGNWSSTQFMVTNNATNNLNASSTNYIAYLWDTVSGYSAFGSYTGNASTDGPFIFTGFRPRFVLVKNTSVAGNWYIFDTSRSSSNGANVEDYKLYPDTSNAENGLAGETTSTNNMDTLSNGFKLRTLNGNTNGSTNVFIYAAFAENPFKISRAR